MDRSSIEFCEREICTEAPVGQWTCGCCCCCLLQDQRELPRPSRTPPPETVRPSTDSKVIHRPVVASQPYPLGATSVPAMEKVTAWVAHGPLNVALPTRNMPGGTSTVAWRGERHASAHARRNGSVESVTPSGRAP